MRDMMLELTIDSLRTNDDREENTQNLMAALAGVVEDASEQIHRLTMDGTDVLSEIWDILQAHGYEQATTSGRHDVVEAIADSTDAPANTRLLLETLASFVDAAAEQASRITVDALDILASIRASITARS